MLAFIRLDAGPAYALKFALCGAALLDMIYGAEVLRMILPVTLLFGQLIDFLICGAAALSLIWCDIRDWRRGKVSPWYLVSTGTMFACWVIAALLLVSIR